MNRLKLCFVNDVCTFCFCYIFIIIITSLYCIFNDTLTDRIFDFLINNFNSGPILRELLGVVIRVNEEFWSL